MNSLEPLSESHLNSGDTRNTRKLQRQIQSLNEIVYELRGHLEALELSVPFFAPTDIANGVDFYSQVREFEISLIRIAMRCASGSQARAANLLNLSPSTLNNKIKVYQIELPLTAKRMAETRSEYTR